MKTILFVCILLISSVAFAQDKPCTLWLGDPYDSTSAIKQTAEQYLQLQTKPVANDTDVKNIYEMKDDNGLAMIKIWVKPKKVLMGGTMATLYVISSYKITSVADKIEILYKALKDKITHCTIETGAMNTLFGINKMFIEKQGGDFSKKNIAMATLTVTAK